MNTELTAAERHELEREERFEKLAVAARRKVTGSIAKHLKLISNLHGDLEKHGNPEIWKRNGDLLLANVHNAIRKGDAICVTDYFDEDTPTIEIIGESNLPINEIAESYFRRYTKARNAKIVIAERISITESAIQMDTLRLASIEIAIETGDADFLKGVIQPKRKPTEVTRKKKTDVEFNGARKFVSSDGFEILVGKKASDNDFLTFRVARSLDTWMHAADFPGSHVVVRNPNRKEIPQLTLHEAARLAAFYSDARKLEKAAVNFTLKKFVNKPKRSAPGLVSLASFKTLYVETTIPDAMDNR
ncbi:MAG: NFACT RNA binding domain-containing protein [Acidobacteriota bacterium]